MYEHSANFNIHNLFRFRVSASKQSVVELFKDKFAFCYVDQMEDPHIEVFLGKYDVNQSKASLVSKESMCGDDFVHFDDFYKIVKWKIMFKNLETDQWHIYCHSNLSVGYEAFITKILRPFLSLRMILMDLSLVHCSSVSLDSGVYAFAGFPGVGKSSMALYLLRHNTKFMSDENTLINKEGKVYNFPLSVPTMSRLLKRLDMKITLSPNEKMKLILGDLVELCTFGFLEKALPLQPLKHFRIQEEGQLKHFYVLTKSTKPFSVNPISAEECAHRLKEINNFELLRVHHYLKHYLFMNQKSRLNNSEIQMVENYLHFLNRCESYSINIDQTDIDGSFQKVSSHLNLR